MTYEEAVKWFGEHMLKIMNENGHKCPIVKEHLFKNLMGEAIELHSELVPKSTSSKRVIKESVDVANYAMMIALDSIGIDLEPIHEGHDPFYRYG